jgi:hypothetical protein
MISNREMESNSRVFLPVERPGCWYPPSDRGTALDCGGPRSGATLTSLAGKSHTKRACGQNCNELRKEEVPTVRPGPGLAGRAPWHNSACATMFAHDRKRAMNTRLRGTRAFPVPVPGRYPSIGIPAILCCHSAGPVLCTLVPFESTATVTGMSRTVNS